METCRRLIRERFLPQLAAAFAAAEFPAAFKEPACMAEALRAPSRAKSSHGLIPICTCGGETAPKEVRFANCRVHPFHAFEDLGIGLTDVVVECNECCHSVSPGGLAVRPNDPEIGRHGQ